MVIDGYGFAGGELFGRLSENGARLFVADDHADREIRADIIWNQATNRLDFYDGDAINAKTLSYGPGLHFA